MLFFTLAAQASVVLPGDGPYLRYRRGDTLYIYDEAGREVVPQLSGYHEAFRRMYDKSYGWRLDERQDLILTSYRHQVANAWATTIPNIKTVWYPSGAAFLEDSATSSWLLTLDAHETAHLYQLNAKGDVPAALGKVLGNAPFAFFFVWPIFIHPNFFTPTFMVEGNAVLQESRINQGGRLHSGEMRALVLAQIKDQRIDPTRLINDQFRFPFGQNAYLQGGYFQAHLAAKHGIEKTNQFFLAQGDRYLWPLILNKTFREHFGASYPQEIREYVRGMEGLAVNQQSAPGEPEIFSILSAPMNHDSRRIWFLATDGKEPPRLFYLDKSTKQFSERTVDLALGKVFFEGGRPLAVDSQPNDLHHITYSLYGEGQKLVAKYKGQIVTDQRAGKTAALDATNSWFEARLLVDGVPYDITHSTAILDDAGNIYYFRQNGAERMMYKNREPLFKMDGFYAKPTEVRPDGSVYFIGATDYGSTLYRFHNQEITRVLKSDRVVDARAINDGEFLIDEIGADGHSFHIVKAEPKAAAPAVYSYPFASENVVPGPVPPFDQVAADDRPYNGLKEMRYSLLEMSLLHSSSSGLGGGIAALFSDPLAYHELGFGYAGSQFRDQALQFAYAYSRYLADIVVQYRYEEEWWERADGTDQAAYNQDVALGLRLPFLRHRRWDGALGLALTYEHEDTHQDSSNPVSYTLYPTNIEELYGLRSKINLVYDQPTLLGMYSWRRFGFSAMNKLRTIENRWTKKHNTSIVNTLYQHGFPLEMYATGFATAAWAETDDIDIEYSNLPETDDAQIPMLTGHKKYKAKNAYAGRFEFHKVFNLRGYSARIPVGLDRLAPFVVAQGVALNDDPHNERPHSIFEWGYGADLQVLLFHRIPTIVRIMNGYNTTEPLEQKSDLRLEWKLKRSF